MIRLPLALAAWNSALFEAVLKQELQQLDCRSLPLQQGLTQGNVALDDAVTAIILSISHDSSSIHVRAGLHYTGMIAGCACADDPTPESRTTEYCTVLIDIDRTSADTRIALEAQ